MTTEKLYTQTSGRFSLPQFQMLGLILMALGAYLLYLVNWFGITALLAGAALYFAKTGIQIDFEKKLHRDFIGLFNLRLGKWENLPDIDYVTIFVEKTSQRGSVASIDSQFGTSKFKINLIISKTIRFNGGTFCAKEEALLNGKLIAFHLKTKLLDYTEKEPKWLDVPEDKK